MKVEWDSGAAWRLMLANTAAETAWRIATKRVGAYFSGVLCRVRLKRFFALAVAAAGDAADNVNAQDGVKGGVEGDVEDEVARLVSVLGLSEHTKNRFFSHHSHRHQSHLAIHPPSSPSLPTEPTKKVASAMISKTVAAASTPVATSGATTTDRQQHHPSNSLPSSSRCFFMGVHCGLPLSNGEGEVTLARDRTDRDLMLSTNTRSSNRPSEYARTLVPSEVESRKRTSDAAVTFHGKEVSPKKFNHTRSSHRIEPLRSGGTVLGRGYEAMDGGGGGGGDDNGEEEGEDGVEKKDVGQEDGKDKKESAAAAAAVGYSEEDEWSGLSVVSSDALVSARFGSLAAKLAKQQEIERRRRRLRSLSSSVEPSSSSSVCLLKTSVLPDNNDVTAGSGEENGDDGSWLLPWFPSTCAPPEAILAPWIGSPTVVRHQSSSSSDPPLQLWSARPRNIIVSSPTFTAASVRCLHLALREHFAATTSFISNQAATEVGLVGEESALGGLESLHLCCR
jgi:hypothetical protein